MPEITKTQAGTNDRTSQPRTPPALSVLADAPPQSADPSDSAPALEGVPFVRPSLVARVASVIVVIVPFLGLIAASILFWDTRFSWLNLGMLLGGYAVTALGITIGYHRLFTHKSFRTNRVVTAIVGVLGSMAVEGPILQWVATHRRHHQHTDREEDPHSPNVHGTGWIAWMRGMYHSHVGWFFTSAPTREQMDRYVPDLQADPLVRGISRLFGFWAILGLIIPAAIALAVTQTWFGALMGFIWGGLVRVFLVHHVTWSINSICHLWGSQPFNTHDDSRNNAIFGVLAFGEGWHNNHHAFPSSARHGLEWWQIDVSYLIIRGLALLGLADDLKGPAPERIASKRIVRRASRAE
jgi:stearoyl-CoA desaturase (Delta-9 desaturase)